MSDDKKKDKPGSILNLAGLSLAEGMALVNKRYGANTVILASKAHASSGVKRISTGITALDIALGGGLPEGRFIEFHGPYSSFKSTTSLVTIAGFQRKYKIEGGLGLYIDLERTLDTSYAKKLGVDLNRLMILNPDSGEQAINAAHDLISMDFPLFVVLDSLAALTATAEMEAPMDQAQMGLQARLVNRMFRVLTARMKRDLYDTEAASVTVLVLNQLRQKIGIVFGNPETTPGGVGKDFAYSAVVRLAARHGKAIVKAVTKNTVKREIQFGQFVTFKVVKNKCSGPQHEEGEFVYYERDWNDNKAHSFNNAEALFDYGAFCDVIEFKTGVGFTYNGTSAKNRRLFIKKLNDPRNVILCIGLKRKIIEAMKNPTLFTTEDKTEEGAE